MIARQDRPVGNLRWSIAVQSRYVRYAQIDEINVTLTHAALRSMLVPVWLRQNLWEVSKIAKHSLYADYQIAAVKIWARTTVSEK